MLLKAMPFIQARVQNEYMCFALQKKESNILYPCIISNNLTNGDSNISLGIIIMLVNSTNNL